MFWLITPEHCWFFFSFQFLYFHTVKLLVHVYILEIWLFSHTSSMYNTSGPTWLASGWVHLGPTGFCLFWANGTASTSNFKGRQTRRVFHILSVFVWPLCPQRWSFPCACEFEQHILTPRPALKSLPGTLGESFMMPCVLLLCSMYPVMWIFHHNLTLAAEFSSSFI